MTDTHESRRWLSPIRQARWTRERVFLGESREVRLECLGPCGRWLHLRHFLRGEHGLIPMESCNRCRGVPREDECPECDCEVIGPENWNRVENCCTSCIPNI